MSGILSRKKNIPFLLMVEDNNSQVSVQIRIVKRKIQEIRVKLRGFEM